MGLNQHNNNLQEDISNFNKELYILFFLYSLPTQIFEFFEFLGKFFDKMLVLMNYSLIFQLIEDQFLCHN